VTDEPGDSDLRKRAAWLLAMLALVAVLFVVLLTTLLNSGGGGSNNDQGAPDDSLTPSTSASAAHPGSKTPPTSAATSSHPTHASCPTTSPCALNYDIGNAVAAINNYRRQNNQKAVPGSVSSAAKRCALGNGNHCSGGYAESQVTKPTGEAALAKVSKLGKLLDSSMKSFAVGWAYDPQSKNYYFAVIRND
jgi:hypothetical protein